MSWNWSGLAALTFACSSVVFFFAALDRTRSQDVFVVDSFVSVKIRSSQ